MIIKSAKGIFTNSKSITNISNFVFNKTTNVFLIKIKTIFNTNN